MVMAADWIAFGITSLAVAVSPGPATAHILACSLRDGSRAGLSAVAGLVIGSLLLGLACTWVACALPAKIPVVLDAVRIVAPWVVILMALRMAMSVRTPVSTLHGDRCDCQTSGILRGILVNLFNPGQLAVFLFVVPRFRGAEQQDVLLEHVSLALLFTTIAALSYFAVALLTEHLLAAGGKRLIGRRSQSLVSATVLAAVALYLFASPLPPQ